ncbi:MULTISPECIES: GGDEF domain-containing protein [unclassified Fibrobacter]|uniref:GGDEF domain-containing protein n=1 Tax=unclassified Fibrobacter TaxID=2634177 RepID=UPI000D6DA334|nr:MULTISPECIES: GGDEF domain-containing protein [unclassified Fibrobacter]PWJ64053.1 diguanylate cyclase (GGDEF)-like protein [Fibrobacter sp. UWR4]PZW69210.1 diguanylate cyclase (GGDEF)-like protein [Fibrobacter sp. UWR1]
MPVFEVQPQLVVLYPQKMFKQFPLEKGTQVLGRGQDADIRLEDDLVSRRHCEISFDGTHVTVTDLGSTNGTFVDGCQIQTSILKDENRLQVGCMVLKVEFQAPQGLFDLKVYEESTKDPLTGVMNFKTFDNRSFGELSMARLNDLNLHVATVKLTNYESLQETQGEPCGDMVLKDMGRILREETRDHDLLARLNGDTFVLLVTSMQAEDARKHLEKICGTIQHHRFSWKDGLVPVNLQLKVCSRQGKEVGTLQEMLVQCL